jgi:hypothetical protein
VIRCDDFFLFSFFVEEGPPTDLRFALDGFGVATPLAAGAVSLSSLPFTSVAAASVSSRFSAVSVDEAS